MKVHTTSFKVVGLLLAVGLLLPGCESVAQSYPSRPIKLVVGYVPGGGTDSLARIVAQKLGERLGQQAVVENRPGANATIGVAYVAKADPDGYTLLVGASGEMVYAPGLYERLPYDTARDFAPVIQLSTNPALFAAHPSLPVTSIGELIALAKAKPGAIFYGSGAAPFQVAGELFKKQAGVDIVNVPYKGAAPSVTAAVAGEVPLLVVGLSSLPMLRAGKLRGLAVTSPKRYPLLPDIPTMIEAGLPGFEVVPWTGMFAPVGTPRAIIDRLNREMMVVVGLEDVKERFAALGVSAEGLPLPEFTALIRADLDKWPKILRELKIRAN